MTFKGKSAAFDSVAERYDAARPSYPEALIQAVIDLAALPEGGRILEIGSGTGQATRPFANRGYPLLCLEPGAHLAAIAAHNFRDYPHVRIQADTFEDWPLEAEAFDLVMSAQAFHWIPEEIGFAKAAQTLKRTGSIALFWNLSPDPEGELGPEIQQVYWECAPEIAHHPGENPLSAQVRALETKLQAQSSSFRDVVVRQFPWSVRYESAQYIDLLNTYSDHLALPDAQRSYLHSGIAQVLERHGGDMHKPYLSRLLIARRV